MEPKKFQLDYCNKNQTIIDNQGSYEP